MLLLIDDESPRVSYVTEWIGKEIFGRPLVCTQDKTYFRNYTGGKIAYTEARESASFWIKPIGLLSQTDIRSQEVNCFNWHGLKAFFQQDDDLGFDLLSAVFYLLSRYEEYLPYTPDEYGRFPYNASLAYREDFLDQPLINQWLQHWKQIWLQKEPDITFARPKFNFIPTYDIDIAWSYKNKGWWRTTGAWIRAMLKGNIQECKDRWAVWKGNRTDPYDSYEWLDALHLYAKIKPHYFFLVAEKAVGNDRNILPTNKELQRLITYQSTIGTVGLHPSWQSGDQPKLLKTEQGWLEFLCDHPIEHSRQHYIRMSLPVSYQRLIAIGIQYEYSMGYGSINGFRASVASSFYWFDLSKNQQTDLQVFPFCFMDANAKYEEGKSPAAAFQDLMGYYQRIKQVDGLMITIWHNQFFGTDPLFAGWKEVYEVFIREELYWDMLR